MSILKNLTIKDNLNGFFINGKFKGLSFEVAAISPTAVRLYSMYQNEPSFDIDMATVTLENDTGVDITPVDLQDRMATLSGFVSKKKINSIGTGGSVLGSWVDYENYKTNNITNRNGMLYVALRDNTNANPETSPLDWFNLLSGFLETKGEILTAADFPALTAVAANDVYFVLADVIDNDPTKTNTGQTFANGSIIVWNGSGWSVIGNVALVSFLNLTDTPTSYIGQKRKFLRVNETQDGLEFAFNSILPEHVFDSEAARDAYFPTKLDELYKGLEIGIEEKTGEPYLELGGGVNTTLSNPIYSIATETKLYVLDGPNIKSYDIAADGTLSNEISIPSGFSASLCGMAIKDNRLYVQNDNTIYWYLIAGDGSLTADGSLATGYAGLGQIAIKDNRLYVQNNTTVYWYIINGDGSLTYDDNLATGYTSLSSLAIYNSKLYIGRDITVYKYNINIDGTLTFEDSYSVSSSSFMYFNENKLYTLEYFPDPVSIYIYYVDINGNLEFDKIYNVVTGIGSAVATLSGRGENVFTLEFFGNRAFWLDIISESNSKIQKWTAETPTSYDNSNWATLGIENITTEQVQTVFGANISDKRFPVKDGTTFKDSGFTEEDTYFNFEKPIIYPKGVGKMNLSDIEVMDLANAGQYYKITGIFTDDAINELFTTLATNKLTCLKAGKYHFNAAAVLSVDKLSTITLALYKNGSFFIETPHGVNSPNSDITPNAVDIFNIAENDYFELYVKSNIANTQVTFNTLNINFSEV